MSLPDMPTTRARHGLFRLTLAIVAAIASYIVASQVISFAQNRAMHAVTVGTTEGRARASFWFTPEPETANHPGPAAAFAVESTRCMRPCVLRLWWVHPLLPGLEAWTVDIDKDDKVIGRSHWSSP